MTLLQFAHPAAQAPMAHWALTQAAELTWAPSGHALPQVPQLFTLVLRSVSHPSNGFPLQFA